MFKKRGDFEYPDDRLKVPVKFTSDLLEDLHLDEESLGDMEVEPKYREVDETKSVSTQGYKRGDSEKGKLF